jgi:hypothetical protein
VPPETAIALGNFRRQGYAVSAVLIALEPGMLEEAMGLLITQGIMDIRVLADEDGIPTLCQRQVLLRTPYVVQVEH